MRLRFANAVCVALFVVSMAAAQSQGTSEYVNPNLRVEVPGLSTTAAEPGTSVAPAALHIVLKAQNIHCDRYSEVETAIKSVSGNPLKELVGRISGTSCATGTGTIRVAVSFVPNSSIRADDLIAGLQAYKPQLINYQNNLYVLYGAVYDEHVYSDGTRMNVIRELLLLDPRYRGKKRAVVFVRDKDDFKQIEGVATIGIEGRQN